MEHKNAWLRQLYCLSKNTALLLFALLGSLLLSVSILMSSSTVFYAEENTYDAEDADQEDDSSEDEDEDEDADDPGEEEEDPDYGDLPEQLTLKIIYTVEEAPFHLYRVADFSETAQYTLSGDFEKYRSVMPTIHATDRAGWLAIAQTLSNYVAADEDILSDSDAEIEGGEAVFEELDPGLYLLLCDGIQKGAEIYHSTPMLISLPAEKKDGVWQDTLTVDVKPGLSDLTGDKISYSVVKHWENIPDGTKWPDSIQVELRKNGEQMEGGVKTLSAANDWSATWENLDETGDYTLTEVNVPKGFTVKVTKTGTKFTLTNTCLPDIDGDKVKETEQESETDSEEQETEQETRKNETPETEEETSKRSVPGGTGNTPSDNQSGSGLSRIVQSLTPKTGDDSPIERWMVLLAVSGLVLIWLGCRLERRAGAGRGKKR